MPAFPDIAKIKYEGPASKNPLAFRQYNEALQNSSRKFANWSKSFFVYTRDVVIIRDAAPLA